VKKPEDITGLIACEESGIVRDAFYKRGFKNVVSCDILPSRTPGNHYQGDVMDIINDYWDFMVAFPPCTHLTSAGAVYWPQKRLDGRMKEAIEFFLALASADIDFIALENPVGVLSKQYRKPDQIINPFNFGTPERKRTCLWLKNLPKLVHTNEVEPIIKGSCIKSNGRKYNYYHHQGKSSKERSKFWPCIAEAMAEQWGNYLLNQEVFL
jgi:hypothetical protein